MKIKLSSTAKLPTAYAQFEIMCFKEGPLEHLAIYSLPILKTLNLRIHSECLTGDVLKSLKCDCGEQLDFSLKYIAKHGGMVLYLRQEGRGIGLFNKINAYALQDKGFDTIEANHQLGFDADERDYAVVEAILQHFGVKKINLLTNNPNKLNCLQNYECLRVPILINPNKFNKDYLEIKHSQMGHLGE